MNMILDFVMKCKDTLLENVMKTKGSDKRITLAKMARQIGVGGQSVVAKIFGVSRNTIRKGRQELDTGQPIEDHFGARGRHLAEKKLPNLLRDIVSIVDTQSQTDPSFQTTKLYTRLTVNEIRKQLVKVKGYTEAELPTNQTLNTKINLLGYKLKKVRKVKPLKKIEQTDAIFENLKTTHEAYKDKDNAVRISIDTKDRVKIGGFSRGGYNRVLVKAADHDFSDEFVTPFGILDVTKDEVDLSFTKSKVTADFMVDAIERYWVASDYHLTKDTLILNADNGPENSSRRTQFMKRMVEFSARYNVKIILAYYPPYHSKYNMIERIWGRLEQHWNGDLLSSEDMIYAFARSMTWKGKHPVVRVIDQVYETGKKLSKKVMGLYESMIQRDENIGNWFITILPDKCKNILNMENST
jgi:hypothetical protein